MSLADLAGVHVRLSEPPAPTVPSAPHVETLAQAPLTFEPIRKRRSSVLDEKVLAQTAGHMSEAGRAMMEGERRREGRG